MEQLDIFSFIQDAEQDAKLTQEQFEKKYDLNPGDARKTPVELGLVKDE